MKQFMILFFALSIGQAAAAVTEQLVSKIYDKDKVSGAPPFVQKTVVEKSAANSFVSTAKIENQDGKVMMTEKVVVKDGELVSQEVEQLQTGEAWHLEVKDGIAYFKTFKVDGSDKKMSSTKSEGVSGDFINGPLTERFIQKNWTSLAQGKSVDASFSILELEKSVKFRFIKERESQRDGKNVWVIKMKPANFLISMFVEPLHMEFDTLTKQLVYFKGRTPLKTVDGSSVKPMDAEIFYERQ